MSSTTETRTVIEQIVDRADERELFIVGKLFEHPPYFHAGKGGDTRLARALRLCLDGRITPNSDGSYTVEGSAHRTYRVAESCSCPNSQKAQSRWCYHAVAVALYVEWQRRLHPTAPVVLGTLRAGTLPLPPVTVNERLAQAVPETFDPAPLTTAFLATLEPQEDRMPDEPQVRITVDGVDYPPHTPQEDRMADDEYTPEPDDQHTPTAIVEPHAATPALRPRTPQVDDLEAALQVWTAERAVVQRFLKQELRPNVDYYTLKIGGKESKPSLSKAGAEKVMGWLKLQASFTPDTGTWEMLGKPTDLVCFVCTIRTRSGEIVGEGRGARSLKKDNGDVNKAIKMAEKSSMVSAVLRTGALSDVFTQDLEPEEQYPSRENAQEQRAHIWSIIKTHAPEVTTSQAVEAWINERTGLALEPDNYSAILRRLGA